MLSPEEKSVLSGANSAALGDALSRKGLDAGSANASPRSSLARISRLEQMKQAMMKDPAFRHQYSPSALASH